MPSKLRRAFDAVKDNASLSLALVSGSSDIYIAVLRATSHDPSPSDEEAIMELLFLASSSPESAVRALSRRLSRTSSWVVAVKSLALLSRAIYDAGPDFRREALAVTTGNHRRLLDLSEFSDSSGLSSPWDFTAFVRTFALYLDARLEASATGKLPRRPLRFPVSGLKPPVLIERILHWQYLVDRAMGTRPTGQARAHRLVRFVFHSVVRETFDIYRDITDGISFLLDGFFNLPGDLCVETFQVSKAAAKQFEELEEFYNGCRKMGIGRKSEYPSVRKISASLLETLEGLLKDRECAHITNQTKLIVETEREEDPPVSENWELALAESMKELSDKCVAQGAKTIELGASNQESPDKKRGFSSGFRNPFLRASHDKSFMAVTPSPSSLKAPLLKKRPMIAANERSLMEMRPSPLSLWSECSREQIRGKVKEDEEEDPFEELARRERPPLMSDAARDFREQYHMKGL